MHKFEATETAINFRLDREVVTTLKIVSESGAIHLFLNESYEGNKQPVSKNIRICLSGTKRDNFMDFIETCKDLFSKKKATK